MDSGDLKFFDTLYFSQGFRIAQLDVEGNGITAVWQPGSGEQRYRTGMSFSEFKLLDLQYFAQGLRLAELDRDGSDWAAVWRPGSGEQQWRSGIPSWLDFKNQDQVFFNQGLRLTDVIITSDTNITAVWRADQGSAGQLWQSGIPATGADEHNESDFQRINRLRLAAGWELRILKSHPNDSYMMAVWRFRGGSFSQSTATHQTFAAYKSWAADCQQQGRRIVSVDVK